MIDLDRQENQQNQGMIADGFSSQEEVYTKKVLDQEQKKDDEIKDEKMQVKFILPPPQQIKSKAYSLLPDKLTGWGIKKDEPNPIPITFGNRNLDNLITKMLESTQKRYQVVYLGPRYQNTFYAWRDKNFPFPYSHISLPKNVKYKKRPFLGQNPEVQNSVHFDSIFESGNLDAAIKVNSHQYDLFLRVDSNTRGHFNWFNFIVSGLSPKQRYKFNICNMERGFCLYTRGMKPYMKSLKIKNDKWKQSGLNVTYAKKEIRFAKFYDSQLSKKWSLSFQVQTQIQNDHIQISYCVPYTYSQVLQVVAQIRENSQKRNIMKQETLCRSLGGLPIQILTVTQTSKQEQKNQQKKCIIICGRVHPGESNGSFVMEGFLQFICGQSQQARKLRKQVVFKIVPMLNPDGVVLGNYRTGLSGKDFNREYRNPDKDIFPEVYFFKKLVTEMKILYKNNLFMFLDFHGHSTKKNVFAYGPQFSMVDKNYYQARIFAKMLQKQNKMFRYHSCVFKVSQCKLSTARAILMKKINIPFTYTIEASNGFYHDKQLLLSVPFQVSQWIQMGESIGKTIGVYVECILSSQRSRRDRQKAKIQLSKVKGGKSGSKSASPSPLKKQVSSNLIMAQQDAKIQKIYDQILKQQNQGPNEINSDDNISEGSSDKQDDKDDLSKKQLQTLFSSIKNNNKLGKNKHNNGKLKKIDLTFGQSQLFRELSDDEKNFQESKQLINLKKSINFSEKKEQAIEQVFIVQKGSFFNKNRRKVPNPPKYFSDTKNKSNVYLSRTQQNSTNIINCKFQDEKKNKLMETISVFPSFSFKSRNKIVVNSQHQNGNTIEKNTRQYVISNIGTSPKSIKLIKNTNNGKTIDVLRHGNQLHKKLQHIGLEKFQNSYSKFNRTGFYQKRERTNGSFVRHTDNRFHGF